VEDETAEATVTLGTPAAAPSERACLARACGRACRRTTDGGTWTTLRTPPEASGSDSGGASVPKVTSAGSVTAAANDTPATAAAATIARLLLTSSLCFADPLKNGIGETCGQPKCPCVDCWA
jgi:hypothetical protein